MRVVRMEEIYMRVLVSTLGIAMLFAQSCLGQTSPKTAGPSPQSSIPGFVIAVDGPTPPVRLDLKRLYEIEEPGVYTLYVSRLDENSKTTVRSNTLTLNIVP
jgi:hypothetical protein